MRLWRHRGDAWLLARAWALLAAVRIALTLMPYSRVSTAVAVLSRAPRVHPPDPAIPPARIAWAVTRASRLVPAATCLSQAMTARILLERRGYPTTLRLGARPLPGGGIEAHAWLQTGETVLIGGEGREEFVELRPHRP